MFAHIQRPTGSHARLPTSYSVLLTPEGVVVHPASAQQPTRTAGPSKRYEGRALRVAWELGAKPELLVKWKEPEGVVDGADVNGKEPDDAVVRAEVVGVAGLLKLFHDSYLLLVGSSTVAGRLMTPSRTAHSVETLVALPLDAGRAHTVLVDFAKGQRSRASKRSQASDGEESGTEFDLTDLSDDEDLAPEADELTASMELPALRGSDDSSLKRSMSGLRGLGLGKLLLSRSRSRSIRPPRSATPPITPPIEAPAVVTTVNATGTHESFLPAGRLRSSSEAIEETSPASRLALDNKIIREVVREMRGLIFAKDWDITHRLQTKAAVGGKGTMHGTPAESSANETYEACLPEPDSALPLHKRAEKSFWWNRFISKPLVEAKADEFIMVLMQGFFQSTEIALPVPLTTIVPCGSPFTPLSELAPSSSSSSAGDDGPIDILPLKLTLISRRSTNRPGLRFQRRGVDSAGNVANFVETEFVVGATATPADVAAEKTGKFGPGPMVGKKFVASFVLTRGSIPLYWSQAPTGLKPPPVLDDRGPEEHAAALAKHFDWHAATYGAPTIAVSLAEQHGAEGKVVNPYKTTTEEYINRAGPDRSTPAAFCGWDFHVECRGMKYENIRKLVDILSADLEKQGYFWTTSEGSYTKQQGACRVACVDCLDRTNVVQSALARHVLNTHLIHLGVHAVDGVRNEALDGAFNELWANNGDAISRLYAGTSALKGDFVRTGKRDWRGMVNDATNSLTRMVQNSIADYFKQAMIDYVLGVNLQSFSEFDENMVAPDVSRLSRIRAVAIDTASAQLLPTDEPRLAAWTLLSPTTMNTLKGPTFEEKLVLLTAKAVYCVSYEYSLQKVRDSTRILLGDIEGVQVGAYILSTVSEAARSTAENYGFVLRFRTSAASERVKTYTVRNKPVRTPSSATVPLVPSPKSEEDDKPEEKSDDMSFIAFKAMRRYDVEAEAEEGREATGSHTTGRAQVEAIVNDLLEKCKAAGALTGDADTFVERKAIISLSEAQSTTTLMDRVAQRAKHFIWL